MRTRENLRQADARCTINDSTLAISTTGAATFWTYRASEALLSPSNSGNQPFTQEGQKKDEIHQWQMP